ncbi:MAG: hypothetical protein ACOX76_00260 [Lachnospiraceae bacterium]|jgi:hypothetical protein
MLKKNSKSAVYISILLLVCVIGTFITNQGAYAKKKTITIETGKTYQLKVKKGSKIKCSNKKIAKVTKKGKIKAFKEGKCKIEVKKGKRIIKYIIRVKNVKEEREEPILTPNPTPIANPTERPNTVDGGDIYVKNLTVSFIDRKDDNKSIVYLTVDGQTSYFDKNSVKIVRFEYPNEKLLDIKNGDKVSIGFNAFNVTHEINNGTDTIKGIVMISQAN